MKEQVRLAELLPRLLRYSLFGDVSFSEAERQAVIERTSELYALAQHHDLSHLLCHALTGLALLPSEGETLARLQKQQMISLYRCVTWEEEQARLLRVLNEASLVHIPLKGAVIRQYYPEAWMRTSCDIDILIREEDVERAVGVICEQLQYTCGERHYHDVSLHSQSGVHLELHFSIRENMKGLDAVLDRVWAFAAPIAPDSHTYALTNEFLMLHLLAHTAYHFVHGGCGMKAFMDYALLSKALEIDEETLRMLCEDSSLSVFREQTARLCEAWFFDGAYDDGLHRMEQFVLRGGVYGTAENSAAMAQGQPRKKRFLRRVFLPYEHMCAVYPVLRKHKILLPVYHVRRWLRALLRGRLVCMAQEYRTHAGVTEAQRDEAAELLRSLELPS